MRKDATRNVHLGTRVQVQQRIGVFFVRPAWGKIRWCRIVLQSRAEELLQDANPDLKH